MRVSLKILNSYALLFFLMICSAGNVIIQVVCILLFGVIGLFLKGIDKNISFNLFYIFLILVSFIQVGFFFRSDYSLNYVINSIIITFMWILAYFAHNFILTSTKVLSQKLIEKVLQIFFTINVSIVFVQYILICVASESIFPFAVEGFGMSTGDYLKGFFPNSSVNMVVTTFYAVFYFFRKETKKMSLAIVVLILTTYMSGIILAIAVVFLYGFFMFSLKSKLKILIVLLIGFYIFAAITPENIKYVKAVFTEKINSKTDPARKVVSFEQTASNFISSPESFFFGEGGGKFSSRTAYLTGGEYVDWFPKEFVYRSEAFSKNHFKLWNNEALRIPYRDGTANQPFSFYNKIIGEYGVIGICLFFIYLSYFIKRFKFLTYGKLILPLLLAFFLLDYWFEYFTVMLFFELFLLLDIKGTHQSRSVIIKNDNADLSSYES